jgi:hypothetical protein
MDYSGELEAQSSKLKAQHSSKTPSQKKRLLLELLLSFGL